MKGRVKYHFKASGSISVLVIEVKPKVINITEELNAIAQVIVECNGQLSNPS